MKNIFCLFLLAVIFSSCEDFFSQTLEVEPPAHNDQMAISAFFTNAETDTTLKVLVARTTAILDNPDQDTRNLDNASIELLSDGVLLTNIPTADNNENFGYNYKQDPNPVDFQSGQSYTLRVNHPDYEEATATITVPEEVAPFSLELEEDGGLDESGNRVDRVTIEFKDPVDQENFYEMSLFSIVTFGDNQDTYIESHYVTSLDFNLQESFYGADLLSDETFNGQDYKLQLDINRYENEDTSYETFLIWRNVNKDYYEFARSVRLQRDTEENFGPFAEPVTIRANFSGGLGLFSINTEQVFPL